VTRALDTGAAVTISDSNPSGNAPDTIYQDKLQTAVDKITDQINYFDWVTEQPAHSLVATKSGTTITVKAGRYGTVNTSGTAVTWVSGEKFAGLSTSSPFIINGVTYAISSVNSNTSITLTTSAGTQSGVKYNAERGGYDGNFIRIRSAQKNTSMTITNGTSISSTALTGGSSNVTWRTTIDFTALGIDDLHQLWMTFAPKLPNAAAYTDTEFTAEFTNWSVTDPSSNRALKIAHPRKSVRLSSKNARAEYSGTWNTEVGFYLNGQAKASDVTDDTITIKYNCQYTHKLNLGTVIYKTVGIVGVQIDGAAETTFDTYFNAEPSIIGRIQISPSTLAAGEHTVVLRVTGTKNAASSGFRIYFDYLEATVEDDVQDPLETYTDRSAAIDYGTNHGYSLPPARLLWMFDRLGFNGPLNEYISVFWWNQRKRVAGTNRQYDVQATGTWVLNDIATVTLSGIPTHKSIRELDVGANDKKLIALGLSDSINTTFSGVWAEVVGVNADTVRIHPRTPIFNFTKSASETAASGGLTETGNLDPGSEGVWEVDETVTPKLNKGATEWHKDFYAEAAARSREVVTACSMEILNPPDDPAGGKVWAARYNNGNAVLTDVGFGTEAQAAITGATNATPIVITAEGHGYRNNDPIVITGVGGNTAANGVWLITVLTADTFSLNGSVGSGAYTSGGLAVRQLKTTHCSFVSDVTDYQKEVFKEIAGLMNTAGLTPWLQFGEFLWWFFSSTGIVVTGATNATPIVITANAHGYNNGDYVIISGVKGNTAANGTWAIANKTANTFELVGSDGNAAFTSSPDARARGGSMGYYDDDTKAQALIDLGVTLHVFNTQDDPDATTTWAAHTAWLAGRIKTHCDAISAHVKATYAGAKFELLWPNDVNYPTCHHTLDLPFPQGGRTNRAVNLPAAYLTKAGSNLDRIKIEHLSWSSFYRELAKSKESHRLAYTTPFSWAKADIRILIAAFNGGCFWRQDLIYASQRGIQYLTFWANDQWHLFSWPVPLPKPGRRASVL
jgi:hypothetical protein